MVLMVNLLLLICHILLAWMTKELQEKIRKSMTTLYNAKCYENKNQPLNGDQIFAILPEFWKKLEKEGLLVEVKKQGFTYGHFVQCAQQARTRAELFANFNIRFY